MKTYLKKIPVGLLVLSALSTFALAADTDSKPAAASENQPRIQQMRQERMQQLEQKLKLTAEQKAKIEEIWDKAGEQGRVTRQEENALRRKRRAERREMMQETRAEVRAVLTPEQQKLFDDIPRRDRQPAREANK